jgi:hypothetical protein
VSFPHDDFDDLASLWAEEPTPPERTELNTIARWVDLRGRLFEYGDLGIGILIAVAVLVALAIQPRPVTMAVGLVAAAGLLWSSWKRHQLKQQVVAMLDVDDRTDLLDRQIRRVTTSLHHALLGLFAAPPVFLLFAMLTQSLFQGGSLAGFGPAIIEALMTVPVGPALGAAMLTLVFQQFQTVKRLRREVEQLHALAGEFREEARLDRIAIG